MNTETLNNLNNLDGTMVEPTGGMDATSADMLNNTAPTVKDQFSTGEKIGIAGAVIVGLVGVGYGIYYLAKKGKAKRAAKKAEKEVKVEKDSK